MSQFHKPEKISWMIYASSLNESSRIIYRSTSLPSRRGTCVKESLLPPWCGGNAADENATIDASVAKLFYTMGTTCARVCYIF